MICAMCNASRKSGECPNTIRNWLLFNQDFSCLSSCWSIFRHWLSNMVLQASLSDMLAAIEVNQSSYWQYHSTERTVLLVHKDLIRAAVDEKLTASVTVDGTWAKLTVLEQSYEIGEPALTWCKSYLSDGTQLFCMNGVVWKPFPSSCAMAQGSALLNSLRILKMCLVHFGNITSSIISGLITYIPVTELPDAWRVLQDCWANISSRFASRRLQLNASKTGLIWPGSLQNVAEVPSISLMPNVESGMIHLSNVVHDLDVVFDAELSVKQHISKLQTIESLLYQLRGFVRSVEKLLVSLLSQWFYRDSSIATHCLPICLPLPLNLCSKSRMRPPDSS